MSVVNIVKSFVDEKEITVYQFSKDTGIALKTAYSLYNNPLQRPSPSVLDKICNFYKCQPCELLKWVESENNEINNENQTTES